jgi:hypothetical protein
MVLASAYWSLYKFSAWSLSWTSSVHYQPGTSPLRAEEWWSLSRSNKNPQSDGGPLQAQSFHFYQFFPTSSFFLTKLQLLLWALQTLSNLKQCHPMERYGCFDSGLFIGIHIKYAARTKVASHYLSIPNLTRASCFIILEVELYGEFSRIPIAGLQSPQSWTWQRVCRLSRSKNRPPRSLSSWGHLPWNWCEMGHIVSS